MTRGERIYRALLRAYPATTRERSGEDMVQLFADRLRDAGSPGAKARVWLEAIADIATTAPRERLSRRRAMRLAEGPALDGRRPIVSDLRVAALPLLLVAILFIARPGYYVPLFDERAYVAGLPFGATVLGMTAIVAMVGILGARRSEDLGEPAVQVVLLACLAPAPFLVLTEGIWQTAGYAVVVTLFVLVARFRIVMLALAVPFAAWLVLGPVIVAAVVANVRE